MRLRSHLVLLVVAVLVPVTAFAAILTALNLRDQRAAVERALAETAAALALAVDRELEGAINTLQTLAASPEIQRRDVARLYAYAQRTRAEAHPSWASIALADRTGRSEFSTSVPLGAPLPSVRDREFFQQVLATRRPVASDLVPGEAAGEQVVVVAVPVLARDGDLTGVLLAAIPPSAWSTLLSSRPLPSGWVARLVDGRGTTIVRNPPGGAEERVGVPQPRDVLAVLDRAERRWVRFAARTGRTVYAVARHSAVSEWRVALAMPAAQVDGPLWRSLAVLGGGGLALVALGIGSAAALGRRIARTTERLRRAARGIGRGELPLFQAAGVRDLDEIGAALVEAAELRQAAEGRLRTTLHSIGDAVIVTDAEGHVTLINPVAQVLTGWGLDALGQPLERVFQILDEARRQPAESPAARVLREGTAAEVASHTLLVTRSGLEIPIEDSSAPIRDHAGRIVGTVLVFRDVTGRRRAEQEREELIRRARLGQAEAETFAELARTINQTLEWDTVVQQVAEAAARLCAADAAFVVEHDSGVHLYTDGRLRRVPASAGAPALVAQVLASGRGLRTERGPEGPELAGAVPGADPAAGRVEAAAAVPIRSGKQVDGVLGVYHRAPRAFTPHDEELLTRLADHAAIALRNAEAFRREQASRAEAEALAGVAHVLAQSLDRVVVAQRVVDSVQRLLGGLVSVVYQLDESTGDLLSLAVAGDPGPGFGRRVRFPPGSALVGLAVRTRQAQASPDILADPRVAASGEIRRQLELAPHRAVLAVPLLAHDRVFGALGIGARAGRVFTDAEIRLAQGFAGHAALALDNAARYERERAARSAAEAANEAKNQFVAMLGHELRNPLGAISSAVGVLQQVEGGAETAARMREVIARQTRHLTRLMDDLLDVSRLESGKIVLRREPLDLAEAARRTVAGLRLAADGPRVVLRAESVPVDGDPTRLEQVIANLLDNAIKYTPGGGTVTLEVTGEASQAVLRVRDDGIGIAPDLLPRLFEPFVQAESSLDRARGGLGLGLAVVKRLVELHGGSVAVASAGVGQGSEFTVRLPRRSLPAPPPPPAAAPPPPAGELSIAVIEDNRDAREGLRLLLETMGHRVAVADSGPAGLELLRTRRPDVAFVDLGLPGLDGFGVARAVRQAGALADTYLVAVTGYGQSSDRERSAEAGFDAHLVKPVDAETLRQVLAAIRPTSR